VTLEERGRMGATTSAASNRLSLAGRSVLVTGGGRGLGLVTWGGKN